jgi:NTE family protein
MSARLRPGSRVDKSEVMESTTRALVLAGGGLTGIGWEVGILAGLANKGVRPGDDADLILGTSAGAVVGARVAQGADLDELYHEQLIEPHASTERAASLDSEVLTEIFEEMLSAEGDAIQRHIRVGALALAADTISEEDRLAVIAARLPSPDWPHKRLHIIAVDAHSGETAVFDAESGVSLVEAVAASCAVPGVWPPTTIAGRRYLDGGTRSADNADLAAGFDQVLVLSPMLLDVAGIPLLESTGTVAVVYPDQAAMVAMGDNPLDPGLRAAAARAGWSQSAALAPEIAEFYSA